MYYHAPESIPYNFFNNPFPGRPLAKITNPQPQGQWVRILRASGLVASVAPHPTIHGHGSIEAPRLQHHHACSFSTSTCVAARCIESETWLPVPMVTRLVGRMFGWLVAWIRIGCFFGAVFVHYCECVANYACLALQFHER